MEISDRVRASKKCGKYSLHHFNGSGGKIVEIINSKARNALYRVEFFNPDKIYRGLFYRYELKYCTKCDFCEIKFTCFTGGNRAKDW